MHASLARCCCWQRRRHMRRTILRCSSGNNEQAAACASLTEPTMARSSVSASLRRAAGAGHRLCAGLVPRNRGLIGIDFRVQDGALYGVGNGGGAVSSPNTSNATATLVNVLDCGARREVVRRIGSPRGPPAASVSDTGQGPRRQRGRAPPTSRSTTHREQTPEPGMVGAACTNNDLAAQTADHAPNLDTSLDQIAIQQPSGRH